MQKAFFLRPPSLWLLITCLALTASACRKKARPSASQPGATADQVQGETPSAGGKGPGAPIASDPNFTAKPIPTNAPPPFQVDPKTGMRSVDVRTAPKVVTGER